MDFGKALDMLKQGKKVARKGWNGKGMFIYLVNGTSVTRNNMRNEADKHLPIERNTGLDSVKINSHIDMFAADGSVVVGWLASQTDMLAEDWVAIEEY